MRRAERMDVDASRPAAGTPGSDCAWPPAGRPGSASHSRRSPPARSAAPSRSLCNTHTNTNIHTRYAPYISAVRPTTTKIEPTVACVCVCVAPPEMSVNMNVRARVCVRMFGAKRTRVPHALAEHERRRIGRQECVLMMYAPKLYGTHQHAPAHMSWNFGFTVRML